MKKLICLLTFIALYEISHSQTSWNLGLNNISGTLTPYFGISNNRSLRFFTNNNETMSIDSTGKMRINNLSGPTARFLLSDVSGNIVPGGTGFTGSTSDFLRADGSWVPIQAITAFSLIGTNLFTSPGLKFGIGTATPINELDVNGSANFSGSSVVQDKIFLGPPSDYAIMKYTPSTPTSPAVFSFGGGGPFNPANPSPGSPYNPLPGGHGGGEHSPDPLPDPICNNGLIPSMALFQNLICIQKQLTTSFPPTNLGNINIGHNGLNAFIETQGPNSSNPNVGDLYINSRCNRNVYVFGNGSPFASTTNNVMSVAGKLNVTQNMQIGGGSSTTNFLYANTQLYLYSPPTIPIGIKIRHGGGGESAIKLVELADGDKAISITRGTPSTDGSERFSVLADGKTSILTSNPDALIVSDASNLSQVNFKILKDGANRMLTSNLLAASIGDAGNGNQINYKIMNNGSTEHLNIANTLKAISIKNLNQSETFSVKGNGYTEINVYSPTGMPMPYGSTNPRALTIRDMTNNRDVFVVRSDGVTYAREVEINLVATFPDYVFDKEYNLLTIKELDGYVTKNKHLPGFEAGVFYEKNGINVNTMLIKQQEKLEELALYIIELEKRLSQLEVFQK